MAQGVIGTRVKLDGEKEYRQAISKLNENLKTLASEMKLASEAYAENADGIDGLAAKGEILQKQISAQQEKVKALDEVVRKSADAYGETDTRTQKYQQSLNYARADLVKMQRALEDNTDRLGKAEGAASDFGKELDAMDEQVKAAADRLKEIDETSASWGECLQSLGDKLGIKLPDSARASLDKLGKLDKSFLAVATGAGAAVAAIVKIEKQLISLTTQSAETMEKLSNAASSGGMSIQSAQEWDHVLRSVGSSLESASGDLSGFQQKIVEASQGAGESAELFKKLGLYVWDASGNLKTTEQMLPELIEKLQGMSDTTERNAIANKLLGGTGTALIPILNQTGDELEALIEEKEKLGILSEGEIEDLKQTAQAQEDFTNAVEAAKNQLAQSFAPAVTAVYEMASNIVSKLSKWLQESGILDWLSSLVQIVAQIISRLVSVAGAITGFLNKFSLVPVMVKAALAPLKFLADTLSVILGAVEGILGGDWDSFQNALNSFGKSAGDTNETSVEDIEKNYGRGTDGYIRSGSNIFNERTKRWEGNYSVDSRIQGIIETVDERPELIEDKSIGATWRLVSSAAVGSKEALSRARGSNAAGIDHWPGGMTWVGENGPERVWLPEGTRIQTAQESRVGGDTFHITIPARDIKEFNDIVRIAKNARRAERMGTT